MYLKSKKLFLYLPTIFLNILFIVGFILIFLYTIDTKTNVYQIILNDESFYDSLYFAIKIALFCLLTSTTLFLLIFYMLFSLKFNYSKDVKKWIFFLHIPILVPYSFCAFLMFMIFFPHLMGTSYLIVIAYTYKIAPFLLLICFPNLLKITQDEINLHKIYSDNSSHYFWKILIKRNLKVISIGLFVVFAYIFNAYEIPFILGSNIDKMPALYVFEKLGEFGLDSVKIAYASSMIYFFITLLCALVFYITYKIIKKLVF